MNRLPSVRAENQLTRDSVLVAPRDGVTLGSENEAAELNDIMVQDRALRSMRLAQSVSGEIPGKFHEARANSKYVHDWADKVVDKKGPLHPKSLLIRGAAALYDMSGVTVAQKTSETLGDAKSTAARKAWETTKLGLVGLEYLPLTGALLNGGRAGRSLFRTSRIGGFSKFSRGTRTLQTGGNTLKTSTAKALNSNLGKNLHPREWGRALQELKTANDLGNGHHGKILANGDYVNDAGKVIGNIESYL